MAKQHFSSRSEAIGSARETGGKFYDNTKSGTPREGKEFTVVSRGQKPSKDGYGDRPWDFNGPINEHGWHTADDL